MVRVDMSLARATILSRKRRRRQANKRRTRAAQRKTQRLQREHDRDIKAAEHAKLARKKAVEKWLAEEKRLEKERGTSRKNNNNNKKKNKKKKTRSVTFADHLLVTEIPAKAGQPIPQPVTSPVGVAVSEGAIAKKKMQQIVAIADAYELDQMLAQQTNAANVAKRVRYVTVADEWSDSSDDDDDPEYAPDVDEQVDTLQNCSQPRRRIQPVRVQLTQNGGADGDATKVRKKRRKGSKRRATAIDDAEHAALDEEKHSPSGNRATDPPISDQGSQHHENSMSPRKKRRKLANGQPASVNDSPAKHSSANAAKSKRSASEETASSPSSRCGDEIPKKRKSTQESKPLDKSPSRNEHSFLKKRPRKESTSYLPSASRSQAANGHGLPPSSSSDEDEEEIDNLFGDLMKLRAAKKATVAASPSKKSKGSSSPKQGKDGKANKQRNSPARYTADGLRIVTYEEIAADQPKGLNGACPFDCSCCF